tara:strand:- start:89 stop:244 length:156 start_codon:yes stop_codon:yes gene_type:complete
VLLVPLVGYGFVGEDEELEMDLDFMELEELVDAKRRRSVSNGMVRQSTAGG